LKIQKINSWVLNYDILPLKGNKFKILLILINNKFNKMNYLIYDSKITGHHSEYISHLIYYISSILENEDKYYFILNHSFKIKFPDIITGIDNKENIFLIEITNEEQKKCNKGRFSNFKIMNNYASLYNIRHCLLLDLSVFELSLIFFRPSYKISGILFMPFYRMRKNKVRDKIRYIRRYILTWLLSKNSKIKTIFVLNDDECVTYLNERFSNKYSLLPDPIPLYPSIDNFDIYNEYKIDRKRKIFLHIGSLREDKGTLDILDSIPYIPKDKREKICLLFIGKCLNFNCFEFMFIEKIKYYQNKYSVQIVFENNFVSNKKMKSLFEQSQCILIPYRNVEGSSGILGHAVLASRPVIGPSDGLLGKFIREYNLGKTIINISDIADSITQYIDYKNIKLNNSFLINKNPSNFSDILLNSIKL
jgi:glycosyltransferase involved in cell wall biosynthesis